MSKRLHSATKPSVFFPTAATPRRQAPLIAQAQAGTRSYSPEMVLPDVHHGAHTTTFYVSIESTLAAACQLVDAGHRVAALNFASAHHRGGGWLSSAGAQEELLARASALVPCIAGDPMYERHN
jgi:uncharacterized protein (TIGR02452 family)